MLYVKSVDEAKTKIVTRLTSVRKSWGVSAMARGGMAEARALTESLLRRAV